MSRRTREPGELDSTSAVAWLVASDEPVVRYRALTWLLDRPSSDATVRAARGEVLEGPIVSTLLDFPDPRAAPYRKWWGLHWRLTSLADLGLPADQAVRARLDGAVDRELAWIANPRHLDAVPKLNGLYRADASIEGNALYAASRFGRADDARARRLVEKLLEWQWPDGGWNCDRQASGYRSSFHESWATAIGLAAYHDATGDVEARAAARRTAELLLEHRLFRSLGSGRPIHHSFIRIHWPAYWHYDLLAGLRVLRAVDADLLADPRATDGLELLESLALPDGRYQATRAWWQVGRHATSPVDVVDWGKGRPSEPLTLHALAVLKSAGRFGAGR